MEFVHDPRRNEGHVICPYESALAIDDQHAFTAKHMIDLLLDFMYMAFYMGAWFVTGNPVVEETAARVFRGDDGLGKRLVEVARVLDPKQFGKVSGYGAASRQDLFCFACGSIHCIFLE